MDKGIIKHIDDKRIYIETKHKKECSSCHGQSLCLKSKDGKRIVPAVKKKHHSHLQKGDLVNFQIRKRQVMIMAAMFYGLPLIGLIVGLWLGNRVNADTLGMIILMALFVALSLQVQQVLKKKYNIFRELDVDIEKISYISPADHVRVHHVDYAKMKREHGIK